MAMKDFEALARSKGVRALNDPQIYILADRLKKGGAEAVRRLSEALLHAETGAERAMAGRILERIGDPSATPLLGQSLLEDADPLVRRSSSRALAMLHGDDAIPPLVQAIENDADVGVRINSAYGLAKAGREDGLQALLGFYGAPEAQPYSAQVLGAIADLGNPETAPLFRSLLAGSKDIGTTLLSIRALETMKDSGALPLLASVIQNGTSGDSVQLEARKAYNAISGRVVYK
jgi:HEAT repeat protein